MHQQPLYRQHIKLCKGQNSKPSRCPAGGVQWRTHARRGGLGGRGHTHPGDRTHHTTVVVGCFHQEDHRCRSLPWMTGAVAITALCRRVRGELPSPSTIVKRWATWRVASDLQTRARGAGPRTGSREDGHARSTHAAETANTTLVRTGKKTGSTQQKLQGQGVEDHLRRLGGTRVGRGNAAAPRRQAPEIGQRSCCDAGRSADACWGAGP